MGMEGYSNTAVFFSESSRVKLVGVGEGIEDLKDVSKIEICYHIY